MSRHRPDTVAAVVLVVCWSSGFVGAEFATRGAPVTTVLAWRTLLAALLLGGWALARRDRVRPGSLLRQACLGLLVQAVYLGGVFAAAGAGVSAGTSALVAALQPLLVAALAGRFLGERTSGRQRAGLLIGAGGVALVVVGDLGAGGAPPLAFLLPVAALAGLSAGTLLERRWGSAESLVVSLAAQSAAAAVVFGTVASVRGELAPPGGGAFWGAMVWLVVLSTLGGYGSYLFVVRRAGATRASTLLYLTPPATAAWAWAMFGQAPGPTAVPGVAVCAVGVTLVLHRARAAAPGRSPDAEDPRARQERADPARP
ncbi:DMT family transporter [Blastococcus sp. VKM Ac-2987]|uniref:DMT family transporter n=1 Tax=Blastococcus sp. VKM Ac-2987 TaxID=3004141 RepID=UPI0022AB572A|nr:DMT family transporter [Blastococcus sp. VKM Ac-2987]MCZ2857367.1 DMT family transporter [Blastococcus sp. VKM Ac-2987]